MMYEIKYDENYQGRMLSIDTMVLQAIRNYKWNGEEKTINLESYNLLSSEDNKNIKGAVKDLVIYYQAKHDTYKQRKLRPDAEFATNILSEIRAELEAKIKAEDKKVADAKKKHLALKKKAKAEFKQHNFDEKIKNLIDEINTFTEKYKTTEILSVKGKDKLKYFSKQNLFQGWILR